MQIDCALPSVLTRHFGAALEQPSDLGLIEAIAAGEKRAMQVAVCAA
jgi:hypothetical protein